MLQKIHERVQGVIAWVLVILIVITFTLWGIDYYLESHSASDVQAKVNGEVISRTDFTSTYQRLKRQAENQAGEELSASQEAVLKRRALKQLIFTRVVLQGAKKAGYQVTQEQAEQALMQIPQFQEDGQFSAEKFQQAMSSTLYTPSIFLKKIQEGLILNQQRFAFAGTDFVLADEMENLIRLSSETRDFSYVIIPKKDFISDIAVSSKELSDYYEHHKAAFKIPEKVSVYYVAVSMKDILANTTVSDKAARRYYRNNMDAYTHPAQWQWAHILIRIPNNKTESNAEVAYQKALTIEKTLKNGTPFAKVAQKKSDDILSASKGGAMPWTSELALNSEIRTALESLRDGEVSAPIKTAYGYEIIQRIAYRAPQEIPFDEVKADIQKTLKMDRAQQTFAQMSDDLTNISYQNPSSLKDVAKELEVPIQSTPLFTRKGLSQGIASYKEVVSAAFSDEVLHDHDNSQLISIQDNLLIVLRIKKYVPQSVMPFDSVKNTVKEQVTQEKAAKKAKAYGKHWLRILNVGAGLVPAGSRPSTRLAPTNNRFSWSSQENVRRDDGSLDAHILSALFQMPHPTPGNFQFQGVALEDGDYALLKLTHVQEGSSDNLDQEEQKMFKDEVVAAFGIMDYNLYVEGLMRQADIVEHAK